MVPADLGIVILGTIHAACRTKAHLPRDVWTLTIGSDIVLIVLSRIVYLANRSLESSIDGPREGVEPKDSHEMF